MRSNAAVEPPPHLVVERRDAAPQPGDRLGQVGALALQTGDPRLDFGGLALGHQIDRAHAVALADQPVQPCRGLGRIGRRFASGELRRARRAPRARHRAARGFRAASRAKASAAPSRSAFEPRQPLASLGKGLIGEARGIGRLPQLRLADRQRIGRRGGSSPRRPTSRRRAPRSRRRSPPGAPPAGRSPPPARSAAPSAPPAARPRLRRACASECSSTSIEDSRSRRSAAS